MKHITNANPIPVSGHPDIFKKVFVENGQIPSITQVATATFIPGQEVSEHKHDTMYEVFYIISGKACFFVAGKEFEVGPGECVVIEPGELHAQKNPFDENVTWVYFGVAVE